MTGRPLALASGRLLVLAVGVLVATPAVAKLDLTLRREGDPGSWIRPTLRLDSGLFYERNAWGGNAEQLIGDHIHGWGEFGAMPGLEGELSLEESGTLRARVSGVFTATRFGLDAAGSNFDDRRPEKWTLEDAYVGWKSGKLFPSLGEDAVDLSIGSQKYQIGTGFLFSDGSTDGGARGGYWLSMRNAFRLTGIARLKTGPFLAEGVFLRPYDEPNSSTNVAGLNLEWAFERVTVGGGYWNVYRSNDDRRDGLNVFDLRFESSPTKVNLPGLRLSGELVHESNGSENDSWGGYGEVGYEFGDVAWTPYAAYRYAHFTGDHGSGDNKAFDPLFYGFYDWGTWYLGEIVGEYVAINRNVHVHNLRLRVEPSDAITANLLYFYMRLDEFPASIDPRPPTSPRAVLITDKSLLHELDLAVDWQANDYLAFSAVAALLKPRAGGRDFLGDDETWSHFMFYTSVRF
jgi:hypothetical protein